MDAEVGHLGSIVEMSSHAHRHVERRHSDAIALELGVEGLGRKPIRGYSAHFHPLRIPLDMMVDAVILRIARGIERRPYRTVQKSTGRLEPAQDPVAEHAAEIGEFRQMRLDETEFGGVDTDHRKLWSLCSVHRRVEMWRGWRFLYSLDRGELSFLCR